MIKLLSMEDSPDYAHPWALGPHGRRLPDDTTGAKRQPKFARKQGE